jgi:hypothetical protein
MPYKLIPFEGKLYYENAPDGLISAQGYMDISVWETIRTLKGETRRLAKDQAVLNIPGGKAALFL